MIQGKVIYINEFGQPDENGKYKVTLQGSFHYNFGTGSWDYDVEKIEPFIPLKIISLKEIL